MGDSLQLGLTTCEPRPGSRDALTGGFARPHGHQIPAGHDVIAAPILAGLHHEHSLEPLAA